MSKATRGPLSVLRDSIVPFADAKDEAAFVEFCFPARSLIPQIVILFLESIMFAINTIITNDNSQFSAVGIRAVTSALQFIFAVIAVICHYKQVAVQSRHVELWWLPCIVIFSVGTLATSVTSATGICVVGPFFQPRWNGTAFITRNSTFLAAECTTRYFRGQSLTAVGPLVIGAPRVCISIVALLVDLCLYFGLRFAVARNQEWSRGDPFRIWFSLVLALPFLAMREYRQRQNFRARQTVLAKMQQSNAAREAVEAIMVNILPVAILQRLVRKEPICDTASCSILYSDIAGFTNWSSKRDASTIVRMLNCMYRELDLDASVFEVDKITTIGDAYWAACGLPTPRTQHAVRLTAFGLRMQKHVAWIRRRHKPFSEIKIRVGIASGTVTGGVIGDLTLQYQVFGPVNDHAEHLEQIAPVNSVTICGATVELIKEDLVEIHGANGLQELECVEGPQPGCFVVNRLPWAPLKSDGDAVSLSVTDVSDGTLSHRSNNSGAYTPSEMSRAEIFVPDAALSADAAARRGLLLKDDPAPLNGGSDAQVEDTAPPQDLSELRVSLAQRKHAWVFLEFADPDLEKAYRERARVFYSSPVCIGVSAAISASMHLLFLSHVAYEWQEQPHHVAVVVTHCVLFVLAALNSAFCRRVPQALSWLRMYLDFISSWVLITFFVNRPVHLSSLSIDTFHVDALFAFHHVFTGVPSFLNWVAGSIIAIVPTIAFPHIFWSIRRNQYSIPLTLVSLFGFGGTLFVGLRNKEVASRNQFIDERVTVEANQRLEEEKAQLESLLARSVPRFILPELVNWLATDRHQTIAHQVQNASILFLRVPAIADDLSQQHSEARMQLDSLKRLVSLFDDNIKCRHEVSVVASPQQAPELTKIKTIGDVILIAGGLHRFEDTLMSAGHAHTQSPLVTPPSPGANQDLLHLTLAAKRIERAVYDAFQKPVVAGIHFGPVVCGVLGVERLVFDCFGDTCNTASRIMSTSKVETGGVGVWLSSHAHDVLCQLGAVSETGSPMTRLLTVEADGERREMKGKGSQTVFRVSATSSCCYEASVGENTC